MKKLTTIVAAIALFFSASAFTPDTGKTDLNSLFKVANLKTVAAANVNNSVTKAFNEKYAKAENVNWSEAGDFYFASFDLETGSFSAAYNSEGEFIAVSRKMDLNKIPIAAEEAIREQYKDYIIPAQVTEIVLMGETNYYFTVEGKNAYIQLKCSPDGNISFQKKLKKKVLVGKVY